MWARFEVQLGSRANLLDERLEEHAHRDEGLLLERVLHVAGEELSHDGVVVVLDERKCEHFKQHRGGRVRRARKVVE